MHYSHQQKKIAYVYKCVSHYIIKEMVIILISFIR